MEISKYYQLRAQALQKHNKRNNNSNARIEKSGPFVSSHWSCHLQKITKATNRTWVSPILLILLLYLIFFLFWWFYVTEPPLASPI